jgi:hypothetical protein
MEKVKEENNSSMCYTPSLEPLESLTLQFSDIRLIDSGKVVSPTLRPLFISRKIPGTHFC